MSAIFRYMLYGNHLSYNIYLLSDYKDKLLLHPIASKLLFKKNDPP